MNNETDYIFLDPKSGLYIRETKIPRALATRITPDTLDYENWEFQGMKGCDVYNQAVSDLRVHSVLSPRRVEVIVGRSSGLENSEVAASMGISTETVRNHLSQTREEIVELGYNFPTELVNLYLLCVGTGKIDIDGNIL